MKDLTPDQQQDQTLALLRAELRILEDGLAFAEGKTQALGCSISRMKNLIEAVEKLN